MAKKDKDKKEKVEKADAGPLVANQRFMGLLLAGDNRAARAEAKKVLADAAATDQDKAAAREVLARTGLDRSTLLVGLAGLAILAIIVTLVFTHHH
ncbi:MAG: hypothetical protein QM765_09735 [Myxococcales bacterium]